MQQERTAADPGVDYDACGGRVQRQLHWLSLRIREMPKVLIKINVFQWKSNNILC